jgi:hypothetical protein
VERIYPTHEENFKKTKRKELQTCLLLAWATIEPWRLSKEECREHCSSYRIRTALRALSALRGSDYVPSRKLFQFLYPLKPEVVKT